MKSILLAAFIFCAFSAHAQLDRISFPMSEESFRQKFPEAKRDLDAESGWVGDTASVYGVSGHAGWRIYNDTIEAYRFSSERRAGPGNRFPKVDSAEVHELKVAADKLRAKFELQIGKPTTFINRAFVGDNPMNITVMYLAEWMYPDKTYLRISVTQDLSAGNRMNAPAIGKAATEEYYELNVLVNNRSFFTSVNYKIGKSSGEFFRKYPQCSRDAYFLRYRHYSISDSATSDKAKWEFVFSGGRLKEFNYFVVMMPDDGVLTEQVIHERLMKKANILLKEGDFAFDKPDTLNNKMESKFVHEPRNTSFIDTLLYCQWSENNERVKLIYTATGGGKNPHTIFMLRVSYIEVP